MSHNSALVVHELCEINPTKVHITIPHHYRISKAGMERYAIHRADLEYNETTRLGAITVTTIMRTLTDSLESVPGLSCAPGDRDSAVSGIDSPGRPRAAPPCH